MLGELLHRRDEERMAAYGRWRGCVYINKVEALFRSARDGSTLAGFSSPSLPNPFIHMYRYRVQARGRCPHGVWDKALFGSVASDLRPGSPFSLGRVRIFMLVFVRAHI